MVMTLAGEGISYSYVPGAPVLTGVSLTVEQGEAVFLLGPNGCGKTTLLECLGGLRRPQEGRVLLAGRDLSQLTPRERALAIAYLPQVHRPTFGYRVIDVVLMGRAPHLNMLASPSREDRQLARRALDDVGLAGVAHRPYLELSGGELRLILIARGLAQGARFLLLDEPDAHLDPGNRRQILELVLRLAGEGLGPLITSHDPNSALSYGDRAVLLREGRCLADGPTEETLVPEALAAAYHVEFALLRGEHGERALVPCQGSRPASRSTDRVSGSGRAYVRNSSANPAAAAKGA
ncbi:MAG: ABC transporter ATP-binding protein [Candidatus Bipolaricaulaceae bacterium]